MLLNYFVLPGRESSTYICAAQGEPEYFPASTSKEEWLKVDEKVGGNLFKLQQVIPF